MIHEFTLLTHLSKDSNQYTNLKTDFNNHLLGYIGEKKLDYYLDFLPDQSTYILHGLRLNGTNYPFQIDTLFLSPNFCLDIEIKNLGGSLFFDKHSKQCFQTLNNTRKGIKNSLTQASRQVDQLRKKFHMFGIYHLPIEYVVVICSSSTRIETNPGNEELFESVFHMEHIVERVHTLTAKYKIKAITAKKLEKLGNYLVLEHSPLKPNLINKYQIDKEDLKKGIQCLSCFSPMIWVKGTWYCMSCKATSKNAHEIGILHYLLNLSSTITNKEWRDFLGIYSRFISFRMLNSINFLEKQPNNSNKYILTPDWVSKVDLEPLILSTKF
jgi:hypothetical protein